MDINWKAPLAAGIAGLLLGSLAFPRQVEKVVEVEKKVVEIKEVEVVKWKTRERVVYRKDGSVKEIVRGETTSTGASSSTSTSQETSSVQLTTSQSSYTLGVQMDWKTTLNPADLSNYRLTAGARIGSLPVFGEVYVQGDLGVGLGLRVEW